MQFAGRRCLQELTDSFSRLGGRKRCSSAGARGPCRDEPVEMPWHRDALAQICPGWVPGVREPALGQLPCILQSHVPAALSSLLCGAKDVRRAADLRSKLCCPPLTGWVARTSWPVFTGGRGEVYWHVPKSMVRFKKAF